MVKKIKSYAKSQGMGFACGAGVGLLLGALIPSVHSQALAITAKIKGALGGSPAQGA